MTTERTFLESLRAYGIVNESNPPRPGTTVLLRDDATTSAYLRAALDRETTKVREATVGARNHTLNQAAYSLGQLTAGAGLDETLVRTALTNAAYEAGLDTTETQRTITSGITAGVKEPRGVPELRPVDAPTIAPFEVTPNPAEISAQIRERFPILNWDELWLDEEEDEWIVEPILQARRLIALYSAPKVGKSLLLLELAACVAAGRPILGVTPTPRRVLYVDFENDPKADIRERLQAMQFEPRHLDNLCYLSFPNLAALDSERGGIELLAAVAEYGCEVVIIDTVSRAVAGEENDNDTWLAFYRHTGLKLKRAQVALVRLDHSGKDETKGQRGGSAKSGDVDAIWRLSKITEGSYRLDCDGARMHIAEQTLVLHRELYPLRHRADAEGRNAVHKLKVKTVVDALDAAGLDNDCGRPTARDTLKTISLKASDNVLRDAIDLRKRRLGAFQLEES